MAMLEIEFKDTDLFGTWKQVETAPHGVVEKVLSSTPETGRKTRLLKFPPGTIIEGTQQHPYCEEVYIIEGFLTDNGKNITMGCGFYACRPIGMIHGPYSSPLGCTMLETQYN